MRTIEELRGEGAGATAVEYIAETLSGFVTTIV